MIISSPGIFHHLLRNDQIHSNSSTSKKIFMHRDIIIRRVMTKFTQISQSSEELRICFNRIPGVMVL